MTAPISPAPVRAFSKGEAAPTSAPAHAEGTRAAGSRSEVRASRSYGGLSGDVRRHERRERFIQAGITVIGRDGYAHTTTRSLCAEAGLTQRYFYESFESIEALFLAVVQRLGAALETELLAAMRPSQPGTVAQVGEVLATYFRCIRHDPNAGRILLVEVYTATDKTTPLAWQFIAKMTTLTRDILLDALPGLAHRGVNAQLLAAGYIGAIHHIALNWVQSGYRESIEEVIDTALRILVAPLAVAGLSAANSAADQPNERHAP